MNYKILQSLIEFQDGNMIRIVVLVDFTSGSSKPYSDVRAIAITNKPKAGYSWIQPIHVLSIELLEEVAGYGYELDYVDREMTFPGWQKKVQK